MAKKDIIYDSELQDWTSEEFKKDYKERCYLSDEEINEMTDDDLYNAAVNDNDDWLQSEIFNLDKELDGNIIVIADLHLWNGVRSGYKVIGNNLKNVLTSSVGSSYKVYCDAYNVRAEDAHHDGTNTYMFREIKENVNIDILKDKIYNGTFTSADISRYTKSLRPYVAKIYGW